MVSPDSAEPFAGTIRKRSELLRNWNVRLARVMPPTDSSPAALEWRGGATPGSITLDDACVMRVDGDRLVVRREGREWQFRAAPDGADISAWTNALVDATKRHSLLLSQRAEGRGGGSSTPPC